MNWKLIFYLSLTGILMGFLTVFGITGNLEWLFWLLLALIIAFIISLQVNKKIFLNGLITGIFISILKTTIQIIYFQTYIQHNPGFTQSIANLPKGFAPETFFIAAAPVTGIIYGIIVGVIALLFKGIRIKKHLNKSS